MNEKSERTYSQMFTLRVWVEDVGNSRIEYRSTLKHILSGETYHSRDWTTLIHHLETAFATEPPHLKPDE
ncbi:MAG: hypothetical protein DWQ04_25920 [Chloroflexi bacterium]|nr:MAG: hypothetical protein DWQ04_25920 [Chloroflexota bacterium]